VNDSDKYTNLEQLSRGKAQHYDGAISLSMGATFSWWKKKVLTWDAEVLNVEKSPIKSGTIDIGVTHCQKRRNVLDGEEKGILSWCSRINWRITGTNLIPN